MVPLKDAPRHALGTNPTPVEDRSLSKSILLAQGRILRRPRLSYWSIMDGRLLSAGSESRRFFALLLR